MRSFDYKIKDALGIHARPAGLLVREAKKYACDLTITKEDGNSANMKSIMKVMSLSVKNDDTVNVMAEGEDETEAIDSLKVFFESSL